MRLKNLPTAWTTSAIVALRKSSPGRPASYLFCLRVRVHRTFSKMSRFRTLRPLHERRREVLLQDRLRERYPRVRRQYNVEEIFIVNFFTLSVFSDLLLVTYCWEALTSRLLAPFKRIGHLSPIPVCLQLVLARRDLPRARRPPEGVQPHPLPHPASRLRARRHLPRQGTLKPRSKRPTRRGGKSFARF